MDTQGRDQRTVSFSETRAQRGAGAADSGSYDRAEQIAADMKTALLADFRYENDAGRWEEDVSVLSETGWVGQCEGLVRRLVQLRETSPLDVVAVCALTDGVRMKPFMYSLGIAVRRLLQRVVLMDCDLRSPWPQAAVDGREAEGFIDMVKHGCSFFTVSRETDVSGLYVIGAGSHPVLSEGELVGKDMERAFNSLRTKADVTLARVPPFLPGRRVNPVLACADAVLVCVSRPSARRSEIAEDFARLWQADVPVLGAVNHEPRDFEERTTVVLNVASRASEAGQPLEVRSGTTAGRPAGKQLSPRTETGTAQTIDLEITPECRPLLSVSEDEVDSGRMFGTGTETPEATPAPDSGAADTTEIGRRSKTRQWSRVRSAEERFLDRELFGRKRISSRLAFLIGLPVVLAALVAAAVLWPRLASTPVAQLDSDMMRSILLPGSDGVVGAGEVKTAQAALPALPAGQDSGGHDLAVATYFVHVSSHKVYENALQDSARVAGAGFRVSLQYVQLSELGRWYRVLAGPFHTATAARAAAARLQPMGLAKQVRIIQQGVSE